MANFLKKMMAFLLAFCVVLGMAGCNVELDIDDEIDIDETRTQLYVGLFNGALGREFMDKIIEEYEAVNPDVQVVVNFLKSEYDDGNLLVQMPESVNDIYYLSSNTYDTFVSRGLLEDLTDTITEKIYDDQGNFATGTPTKSILDTMYEDWRNLFKTDDGKYYAIPNWMSTPGIIYDADVFETLGVSEEKGNLPETYEEFMRLVRRIKTSGYTPFCFSTMDYITLNSMAYFYADYEGRNDFFLNSTYKGTDNTLGEINYANAWKLQQQNGRKAALKFAYDLAHGDGYVSDTTKSGLTHLGAQNEYVMSINTVEAGQKRVAMFLENSYWEREAKSTFEQMSVYGEGYGWGERNFKYLLAPKFIGTQGVPDTDNKDMHTVYGATSNSWACINKASDNKELAKDFMQFVQCRRSLALYTMYSGCLRAYDFTMTPEEYALCTTFTKSVYDLTQREDVEFACFSKQNPILKKQSSDFDYSWLFYTKANAAVGGANANATDVVEGRMVFNNFLNNASLTVDNYFEGMTTYWKGQWSKFDNLYD